MIGSSVMTAQDHSYKNKKCINAKDVKTICCAHSANN